MARISLEKGLTAIGVGVADVLVDKYASGYTFGPLNATDTFRFALAIGSWVVNYMGYERDYSETIFYSSLPLVTHSVADMVQRQTAKTAASTAVRITRVPAPAPTVVSKPTAAIPP